MNPPICSWTINCNFKVKSSCWLTKENIKMFIDVFDEVFFGFGSWESVDDVTTARILCKFTLNYVFVSGFLTSLISYSINWFFIKIIWIHHISLITSSQTSILQRALVCFIRVNGSQSDRTNDYHFFLDEWTLTEEKSCEIFFEIFVKVLFVNNCGGFELRNLFSYIKFFLYLCHTFLFC